MRYVFGVLLSVKTGVKNAVFQDGNVIHPREIEKKRFP